MSAYKPLTDLSPLTLHDALQRTIINILLRPKSQSHEVRSSDPTDRERETAFWQ